MKNKNIELDVDYIGGQEPLTIEEEKAISDFIRSKKLSKSKKIQRSTKLPKHSKVTI